MIDLRKSNEEAILMALCQIAQESQKKRKKNRVILCYCSGCGLWVDVLEYTST
ncbi:MAG: hypothetical protein K0Q48_1413 [Bacillota bacterium]|jgi:hypothetical protein|nr:hypothetical protein [Bacillota bacterium]